VDFAEKIEEDRDKVYDDMNKAKKAYDAQCQTLESKRSKSERTYDMDKTRAKSSYDKHLHEANNAKVPSKFIKPNHRIPISSKYPFPIDIKPNSSIKTFHSS
jgi:hypothetical protein